MARREMEVHVVAKAIGVRSGSLPRREEERHVRADRQNLTGQRCVCPDDCLEQFLPRRDHESSPARPAEV
jgi:hypothetical protein